MDKSTQEVLLLGRRRLAAVLGVGVGAAAAAPVRLLAPRHVVAELLDKRGAHLARVRAELRIKRC